jgi:hypothetical protein
MATSRRTSSGVGELCDRLSKGFNLVSWRIAFIPERSDSTRPAPFQQAAFSASRLGSPGSKWRVTRRRFARTLVRSAALAEPCKIIHRSALLPRKLLAISINHQLSDSASPAELATHAKIDEAAGVSEWLALLHV